jgi:NAD(P)-dependent dehydrogenase (short-subunit alcohol dehydrogenase family)
MSTSSETEFTGKRALVPGGTRGIGEAIVQSLRGAGATGGRVTVNRLQVARSGGEGLYDPHSLWTRWSRLTLGIPRAIIRAYEPRLWTWEELLEATF